MPDTVIVGSLDWELARSSARSKLHDGGVEVLEIEDEASEEECFQ